MFGPTFSPKPFAYTTQYRPSTKVSKKADHLQHANVFAHHHCTVSPTIKLKPHLQGTHPYTTRNVAALPLAGALQKLSNLFYAHHTLDLMTQPSEPELPYHSLTFLIHRNCHSTILLPLHPLQKFGDILQQTAVNLSAPLACLECPLFLIQLGYKQLLRLPACLRDINSRKYDDKSIPMAPWFQEHLRSPCCLIRITQRCVSVSSLPCVLWSTPPIGHR